MLKLDSFPRLAIAAVVLTFIPTLSAKENREIDLQQLAILAESAETPEDFRDLRVLCEQRARTLEEQAAKHDRLEQRFGNAPKSLIAKRGHGWNTPGRQSELADRARNEAATVRSLAQTLVSRASAAGEGSASGL